MPTCKVLADLTTEELWASFQDVLNLILDGKNQQITVQAYMTFTARIQHLHCIPTSTLNVDGFYSRISSLLQDRCTAIGRKLQQQSSDSVNLLEVYQNEWTGFATAAKKIDHALNFINRHWIKREQDEGKAILSIYRLHLKKWIDFALQPIREEMTTAFLKNVTDQHQGRDVDCKLIMDTLNSINALSLDTYREIFENPFIELLVQKQEGRLLQYQGSKSSSIASEDLFDTLVMDEQARWEAFVPEQLRDQLKTSLKEALLTKHTSCTT